MNVSYRAVLATQARFLIVNHLVVMKSLEDVINHIAIDMKLRNVMADVILARITEHVQLSLVDANDKAVRTNPVQTDCGCLKEISEFRLAPAQGFIRELALGDVALDADITHRLSRSISDRES